MDDRTRPEEELLRTPSVEDGVPLQMELSQRRLTCAFMQDAGMKLHLYGLAPLIGPSLC
jgi:hypothetical protein